MRLTRASIYLIFVLLSFPVSAEKHHFEIDIQGLKYALVLTENERFTAAGEDQAKTHGIHYQGHVVGHSDGWVRASLIDGRWQGVVSVHNAMHMFDQVPDYEEGVLQANGTMMSTPLVEIDALAGGCGTGDDSHSMLSHIESMQSISSQVEDATEPAQVAATFAQFCSQEVNGVCVITELEIAFDLKFQELFAAQSVAQAMAIINIVDGHYLNDLKISIDAITLEMLADDLFDTSEAASPVLNAGDLLTTIEMKKNNNQIPFMTNVNALTHLVTGRDFEGGTLGVAYLGSVCQPNGFSTGTSSVFFDNPADTSTFNIPLTAVIVAHELAHNLGANHDGPTGNVLCPASTYIMSPVINPAFNLSNFSACSIEDIETTLSNLNNPALCLDYPADAYLQENSGNTQSLDQNNEFSSSFTAHLQSGFLMVDQVEISGSINPVEGTFSSVIANGSNCLIDLQGESYTCTVSNPATTFQLVTQIQVVDGASDIMLDQSINIQTADVQDINPGNDNLVTMFTISNNDVVNNNQNDNSQPTNNEPEINDSDTEEGGAGSFSYGFVWIMIVLYLYKNFCHRQVFKVNA